MKPELIATLQSAANVIDAVTEKLDRTTTNCDRCTAKRWNNPEEYQLGLQLEAITKKLTHLIRVERGKAKAEAIHAKGQ